MEKETLLTGLKKELGEPAANGYLGDTGVTMRTLEKYAEAILPTITADEMVNDDFFKNHAAAIKAMGGQMRFEQSEFVKNYKPKPEENLPPSPPAPNKEYKELKNRLDELEKARENERKTSEVKDMRAKIAKKAGELNVTNKHLWEDVTDMVPYTDGMDEASMETKVKELYEAKLKLYSGDGAQPYGGEFHGGSGGDGAKMLDAFFAQKAAEGKFPAKK